MSLQNLISPWIYVVVLSKNTPLEWKISYLDIVLKKKFYFHPIGINGWPKEPLTYIGFRYNGKLQHIYQIKKVNIITNPHDYIKEIPNLSWEPCYLYELGEGIPLTKEIRNGRIFPSGRLWCKLDILLASDTISEAFYASKEETDSIK
ncbi:hypothetical protein OCA26_15165 [Bacillus cereus]|uniref:hypothetical protein n=1 Tax=Bacillus sp. BB56-3 TaxID=2217831 RepID=UPI0011EF7397|nr:hypothetical protein [Bacillus sp. BB56-3]KAA0800284.1 hypothetical protein DN406_03910 [Bacillus sp. BB56-3]MCU4757461.1 hypothetical protein [Bacillus cereus]